MSDGTLTTYTELAAVVEQLPLLVREKRRRDGLSLREAARQLGCSFSTIGRLESGGHGWNGRLLADVLRWLDGSVA